jgi:hypothetical protein
MEWPWFVLGGIGLGAVVLLWRPLRGFGREIQLGRARELFVLQRERLQEEFFQAASASGKPRGLRWKKCDFDGTQELAHDRHSRQILALVPVTISFEAIEGGDMEGVAAVGNLRQATAVFVFARGSWHTLGRAVFNLSPAETLEHFKHQYERIKED